jgi:hypothetical protein
VRLGVTPAALRNGSGAENERVAFGKTVLLNRSLADFFGARAAGTVAATGSSVGFEPNRLVNFLKRSRNGIVIGLMILRCHSPHFFKSGHALERLFDSDHAQSFHSFAHRLVLNHRGGRALYD